MISVLALRTTFYILLRVDDLKCAFTWEWQRLHPSDNLYFYIEEFFTNSLVVYFLYFLSGNEEELKSNAVSDGSIDGDDQTNVSRKTSLEEPLMIPDKDRLTAFTVKSDIN